MASLPLTQSLTITTSSTASAFCPFPRTKSTTLNTSHRHGHTRRSVSCSARSNQSSDDAPQRPLGKVVRRDVLVGLGMAGVGTAMAAQSKGGLTPLTDFPLALAKPTTVLVARPKKGRSKAEKEEEEEILVIEGIDYDRNSAVKFDVYVNDEDQGRPDKSEFAGSFVTVPHNTKNKEKTKTKLKLGITDLLEDVGADDDESVLVTLVPKAGDVKVVGIKIVFES